MRPGERPLHTLREIARFAQVLVLRHVVNDEAQGIVLRRLCSGLESDGFVFHPLDAPRVFFEGAKTAVEAGVSEATVSLSQRRVLAFGPTRHQGQAPITPDEFVEVEIAAKMNNHVADALRERLQTVPGIAGVDQPAEKRYAMRLWMDPEKLAEAPRMLTTTREPAGTGTPSCVISARPTPLPPSSSRPSSPPSEKS